MELEPVSSESSAVVASIDDLLKDILLRLPVKPLVRFKSVSKHWNSLISDPKFHLAFCQNPNFLIFQDPFSRSPPLVVTFDKSSTSYNLTTADELTTGLWRPKVKALNSCNGLLLCESNYGTQPSYYVCNPTTGTCFTLPELGRPLVFDGTCLVFDPAKSPHYSVVFVSNYYRVSIGTTSTFVYEFKVFSSETRRWRKTSEPFNALADFSRGVYWNGCVHWLCYSDKSIYFNPNEQTPALMSMPTPHYHHTFLADHYFGESGGHLNFIENPYQWGAELIVQEMREDYSDWFVKYRVDLNRSDIVDLCSVRALVRGKDDEDSFLVFLIGRQLVHRRLVRFNLVYNTLETICKFEDNVLESNYHFDLFLDFPLQYIKSMCSTPSVPLPVNLTFF